MELYCRKIKNYSRAVGDGNSSCIPYVNNEQSLNVLQVEVILLLKVKHNKQNENNKYSYVINILYLYKKYKLNKQILFTKILVEEV